MAERAQENTGTTEARQELHRDFERAKRETAELADAARERGREALESAKADVASGAARIADAVEATADDLEAGGDDTVSGYGRSLASIMRRLAGGLRESDIDEFARELATFARRNPGAFIAGSVALGFGLSRFLKSSAHHSPSESRFATTDDDEVFQREEALATEDSSAVGAAPGTKTEVAP